MNVMTLVQHRAVKGALRNLIVLARALSPTRPHVVVYGWPQEEGNTVELVRHLGGRGFRVYWLLDDLEGPGVHEVRREHPSVRLRARLSVGGFLAYLTARVTCFSHGLYLSGSSPSRKTVVNLWHGDGPKRNFMPNDEPAPGCDYVVSCSTVFGKAKAAFFGLSEDHLLVTGNPRNDRFFGNPDRSALARLDLEPGGYVVYMPTYRSARSLGATVAWQDADHDEDPRVAALVDLVKAAEAHGLEVVVKPHPLDSIGLEVPEARVVDDAALSAGGLNSYELLATSHCLVTDYSSIWTDYLSTGKHVAFAVPDWEEYAGARGLDESVTRPELPGPVIADVESAEAFLRAIETADPAIVSQRDRAIERFGLVTEDGNCRRLVDALVERGVLVPPRGAAA
jgi:CDP-glycerol glycerophosphotransferase